MSRPMPLLGRIPDSEARAVKTPMSICFEDAPFLAYPFVERTSCNKVRFYAARLCNRIVCQKFGFEFLTALRFRSHFGWY